MKIYTRSGDAGETGVIGGRVHKDDLRVEAYGTIDELNCFVGQAISLMQESQHEYDDFITNLQQIQHELFDCGSDLAFLAKESRQYKVIDTMVAKLEDWIDQYDAETQPITRFILPGGGLISSTLHINRTICRRAERRVVSLSKKTDINQEVLKYLNRLSDLFFTMARTANSREKIGDVEYIRSADVFPKSI